MTEREIDASAAAVPARGLDELVLRDRQRSPGTWAARASTSSRARRSSSSPSARDGEELRTSAIEAPRLRRRSSRPTRRRCASCPGGSRWTRPPDPPPAAASDLPRRRARGRRRRRGRTRILTDPEIERYRALRRDTAAATGRARAAPRTESEFTLAGRAARPAVRARDRAASCMLVAGDDRLAARTATRCRPPRRWATASMLVRLRPPPRADRAVTRSARSARLTPRRTPLTPAAASRPPTSTPPAPGAPRRRDRRRPAPPPTRDNGFDADEWHNHHQGGPTGIHGARLPREPGRREPRAGPTRRSPGTPRAAA